MKVQFQLNKPSDSEVSSLLADNHHIIAPLGGWSNYQGNTQAVKSVINYYSSMKPTVIEIEEIYSRSDQEVWMPYHWSEFLCHIMNLIPFSKGFLTEYNFSIQDAVNRHVPKLFKGKLLYRGEKVPVLIELHKSLMNRCGTEHCGLDNLWVFGNWGYIFPREYLLEFNYFVTQEDIELQQIERFYNNVLTFWFGGDFESLYLLCAQQYLITRIEEYILNYGVRNFPIKI